MSLFLLQIPKFTVGMLAGPSTSDFPTLGTVTLMSILSHLNTGQRLMKPTHLLGFIYLI